VAGRGPRAVVVPAKLLAGLLLLVGSAVMLAVGLHAMAGHRHSGPRSNSVSFAGPTAKVATSHPNDAGKRSGSAPIFAIYYLWWDRQHWLSRLGSYPTARSDGPLPATLNSAGCATVNHYPGNKETDISQGLRYDQADPRTIQRDVSLAAKAGFAGFIVNWIGTGDPRQGVASSDYDKRLDYVFQAVHQLNRRGTHFSLILNYQSSAKKLPLSHFSGDFSYFLSTYGTDPALDHTYSTRPEVLMAGTWKYSDTDLKTIASQFRSRLYLIGDEKPASWDQARIDNLDGTSYYWSSQDPVKNRSSFKILTSFANTVRRSLNPDGSPKTWLAPFTPGYNAMLLYGTSTCVPRNHGQTMHQLFGGNAKSKPDGWAFISWNEISEGTYIVPLARYGTEYLDAASAITRANR
jgi:hypothetical protein